MEKKKVADLYQMYLKGAVCIGPLYSLNYHYTFPIVLKNASRRYLTCDITFATIKLMTNVILAGGVQ